MSTSRPVIFEIAARLRGNTPPVNESSAAAVANAADRYDCHCHQSVNARILSSRHSHPRWNRAEAIVSSSKRPLLRDLTWSASDGIVFAPSQRPVANVARRHASRSASRGESSMLEAVDGDGSGGDGFGGPVFSGHSPAAIRDLLAKIEEGQDEIQRLNKQLQERTPQVQLNQQKQQYETQLHNEKSVYEQQLRKERERFEAQQLDLEKQRTAGNALRQKNNELEKARSDLQSKLDVRLKAHLETDRALTAERDAHLSIREEFDSLKKDFDSLKHEHERYRLVNEANHEQRQMLFQEYQGTGRAAAIKEMEPKISTLEASLRSERESVGRMSEELDQARQDISRLETQKSSLEGQLKSQDKRARKLHAETSQHIDSLHAKQRSLEDELRTRAERRRNMPDYKSYRDVWKRDLGPSLRAFTIPRDFLVSDQTTYWTKAQNRWLSANHLMPCLQQYPKIRDSIRDFLATKLTLAREHGENLRNVMLDFVKADADTGKVGHDSRSLAIHAHFDEYPELGGIARSVRYEQLVGRISAEMHQLTLEKRMLMEKKRVSEAKALGVTMDVLHQAAQIQTAVAQKRLLEDIRRAGPVDQGIFVRLATTDAIHNKMFASILDYAEFPKDLIERRRDWLRALSELKGLVYERFHLEEKMGKLNPAEQKDNIEFIEGKLAAAKSTLHRLCARVGEQGFAVARPTVTPVASAKTPSNKPIRRVSGTPGRKRPRLKTRADIKVGNLRPTSPLQAHHQTFLVPHSHHNMVSQMQGLSESNVAHTARHTATAASPAEGHLVLTSNLRHEVTQTKGDSGMPMPEAQPDSGNDEVISSVQSEQCHLPDPLSDEAVEACIAAVESPRPPEETFWSHTQYHNSEGKSPAVYYCTSLETSERQAKLFLDDPVVGFDIEWEAFASLKTHGLKQNVSLIQLASRDKIGLFHVACFKGREPEELMPPSLRAILESKSITKAGVNVVGDRNRIRHCFGIEMKGLLELSHLYRVVHFSNTDPSQVNFKLVSLATQVATMFSLPLRKDETRVSRWSSKLSNQQTAYAATDAYAGFQLFHELEKLRLEMDPQPPRPEHFETLAPLVLGDGTQIARNTRRAAAASRPKRTSADETVIEDDESEEFFDAAEYADDEASYANGVEADAAEMLYPDLKKLNIAQSDLSPQAEARAVDEDALNSAAFKHGKDGKADCPNETPLAIPLSAETRRADAWARSFLAGSPAGHEGFAGRTAPTRRAVNVSSLRAYHLWHEQRFDLREVASFCRQPPLALTTVASYIMTAIKEEDLPFEKDRARKVLAALPFAVKNLYARTIEAGR